MQTTGLRCMMEQRYSDSSNWVTLTYANPPLSPKNLMPTVFKRDVQNFFKRLRKIPRGYSSRSIKYYLCAEYGEMGSRPHYHAIIFNSDIESIQEAWRGEFTPTWLEHPPSKRKVFKNFQWCDAKPLYNVNLDTDIVLGTVHFDDVNENTVAYTAKYMNKGKLIPQFDGDDRHPEFQLFSLGLGEEWLTDAVKDYYRSNPDKMFVTMNGFKKPLPRFFVKKIFEGADDLLLARAEYAVLS